jgi:hypothetical protein
MEGRHCHGVMDKGLEDLSDSSTPNLLDSVREHKFRRRSWLALKHIVTI